LGYNPSCKQGNWAAYRSRNGAHAISAAVKDPQKNGPEDEVDNNSSVRRKTDSNSLFQRGSPLHPNKKAARDEGRDFDGNILVKSRDLLMASFLMSSGYKAVLYRRSSSRIKSIDSD
jgi:hypothetical protein